ncbi:hypothetical protein [Snodgrassella sp. CFCC 13594]|uniref:hypothetical protein n=1 Tax=Snodgrassella sp. CFCC 13594 TaxID=1775559 RepID=UPI00082A368B|nr:hypothetical protein [Snodgrassella sp. CFCC 13594]
MSTDIDDFLNELDKQPKSKTRSVLIPYESEILELKKRGYTESVILLFLEQKKGVKVAQSTLNWFINSRLKKRLLNEEAPQPKSFQKTLAVEESTTTSAAAISDDEIARRPSWASKTPLSELI